MRTIQPQNILADYQSALTDAVNTFTNAEARDIPVGEKKLIAEFAFLAVATFWEGYVSDLFVAYVNIDDSALKTYLVSKMEITASDAYASRAKHGAHVAFKGRYTGEQIRAILDYRDYNITFPKTDALKESANKWLVQQHKTHFVGLTKPQVAGLDAVNAIRNFLAHRSSAAKGAMQLQLNKPDLDPNLRRGSNKVADLGSFLRAKQLPNLQTRLEAYVAFLRNAAITLCP